MAATNDVTVVTKLTMGSVLDRFAWNELRIVDLGKIDDVDELTKAALKELPGVASCIRESVLGARHDKGYFANLCDVHSRQFVAFVDAVTDPMEKSHRDDVVNFLKARRTENARNILKACWDRVLVESVARETIEVDDEAREFYEIRDDVASRDGFILGYWLVPHPGRPDDVIPLFEVAEWEIVNHEMNFIHKHDEVIDAIVHLTEREAAGFALTLDYGIFSIDFEDGADEFQVYDISPLHLR